MKARRRAFEVGEELRPIRDDAIRIAARQALECHRSAGITARCDLEQHGLVLPRQDESRRARREVGVGFAQLCQVVLERLPFLAGENLLRWVRWLLAAAPF